VSTTVLTLDNQTLAVHAGLVREGGAIVFDEQLRLDDEKVPEGVRVLKMPLVV